MKKKSTVIAVRVPLEVAREIDDQCAPLKLSRSDWVRAVILARLHELNAPSISGELQLILERLSTLEEATQAVSRNVAKAAFLILTNDTMSKDLARAAVQRHLVRAGGQA